MYCTHVAFSYIAQLLSENQRLREQSTSSGRNVLDENEPIPPPPREDIDDTDMSVRNPLIGDRAWFHRYDPSAPPIYVGEAACTAFATRFRRFLTGNNAAPQIPRTHYISETDLSTANDTEVRWPTLANAQLLVKVAFKQVSRVYHMTLRRSTHEKLKEIYKTSGFDCPLNTCKFFALFAFGEVFSMRSTSSTGRNVPGMAYFARAINLIQTMPERTSITHIENLLLLVSFIKSSFCRAITKKSSLCFHILSTGGTRLTFWLATRCDLVSSEHTRVAID